MKRLVVAAALAPMVVWAGAAQAQNRTTYYEPNGQYLGSAQPSMIGGGSTNYYGSNGQHLGNVRPSMIGGGGTSYYGPNGRYLGSSRQQGW
jgi:hypothetical protein